MTIIERAVELVEDDFLLGLGTGRAATAFIRALGERVRAQRLRVRGVPTSESTRALASSEGIPLVTLDEAKTLDLAVDGADEVDPHLDLIKGYGRALVREKIVAAAARRLVILVGSEKLVPRLGARGRLPVEIVPFALPLCEQRFPALGCWPALWRENGRPGTTDNGNWILDCAVEPIADPYALEAALRAVPGVVGTGLFLGIADTVLVGDDQLNLIQERHRPAPASSRG